MPTLRTLWNLVVDRWNRDQLSADLDDELRFHQAMLERDQRASGATEHDARRLARRQFGNLTQVREATRAMWTLGWMDDLLLDVRFGARVLRRNLGFSVAVVLTLALGIGANTAIFSVVNAVLFRPLPYAAPEQLVSVWTAPSGALADRNPASLPDMNDWAAQNTVFTSVGAYSYNRFELTGSEGTDQARAAIGTPQLFTVLGAAPLLGRLPLPDEDRTAVVTISYRLWQQRYGGDRGAIGRRVLMDEEPYTIVGVMPPGFHFPGPDIDLWTSLYPIAGAPDKPLSGPWITSRSMHAYRVVARLRPGVSIAAAEGAMNTIEARLAKEYPDADAGTTIKLQSLRDDSVRGVQRGLWLMLGAAGLVLLLACVNVAHLMLARVSARTREIAVRRALGAHRGRIVRQLLAESLLLALVGGAAGILVAAVGTPLLVRLSPADIPRLEVVGIDATTLAFALGVSLLTGVLFGSAPILVAMRGDVQKTLREQRTGGGGRQRGRLRAALTSAEIAFALMLLVGAGLTIRSFVLLLDSDTGFRTNGVVTFHIGFPTARYPSPESQTAGLDRMLSALRALPGVLNVGASTSMPPTRTQQFDGFAIEGQPAPEPGHAPTAIFLPATPHFLGALGIPLLAGRDFTSSDGAAAPPVAIVSREIAHRYFAGQAPLGQRITISGATRTIVGVSGDAIYEGLGTPIKPEVYVPFAQSPFAGVWIGVQGAVAPSALVGPIRDAIHGVDPLINPRELRPMSEMIGSSVVRPRFQTWLLATFGTLALFLAAVGIYGVIAYSVTQRTSEIALRLALGASRSSVIGLVLRTGLMPLGIGLAAGIAGSLALSKTMVGLLYGVPPTDLPTFVGVTLLLAAVAMAASYIPAMRAAAVNPIVALKSD